MVFWVDTPSLLFSSQLFCQNSPKSAARNRPKTFPNPYPKTINKRKIIPKISNPPEFSAISSLQVSILTIRPLLQLIQVLPCRDQGLRCIQLFLLQVTLRLQGVRMVELHWQIGGVRPFVRWQIHGSCFLLAWVRTLIIDIIATSFGTTPCQTTISALILLASSFLQSMQSSIYWLKTPTIHVPDKTRSNKDMPRVHRKTLKDEQLVLWLFPSTRPRQRIERLAITLIKTLIEKKQENSPCMATKGKKKQHRLLLPWSLVQLILSFLQLLLQLLGLRKWSKGDGRSYPKTGSISEY